MIHVAAKFMIVLLALSLMYEVGSKRRRKPKRVGNEVTRGSTRCDEGFLYESKCYFVIIHSKEDIKLIKGRRICVRNGGVIADIVDGQLLGLIRVHVYAKKTSHTNIWVGMSYSSSTRTFRWSNGERVPGDFAATLVSHWFPSFPITGPTYNAMGVAVYANMISVFNNPPDNNLDAVLCVK